MDLFMVVQEQESMEESMGNQQVDAEDACSQDVAALYQEALQAAAAAIASRQQGSAPTRNGDPPQGSDTLPPPDDPRELSVMNSPSEDDPTNAAAGSADAAVTAAATTTTTRNTPKPAGKGRGKQDSTNKADQQPDSKATKRQQQRVYKRRNSASSLTKRLRYPGKNNNLSQQQQRTIPVLDAAPHRFVNPLLELPAVTRSQDLWPVLEVAFWKPDTFSLAYLSRVLGYQTPPALGMKATQPVAWNPHTPLILMDTSVYDKPPEGSFAKTVWRPDLSDNEVLGDGMDPLYLALLKGDADAEMEPSPNTSVETVPKPTPVTAVQLSKLLSKATHDNLIPVIHAAIETKVLNDRDGDWSVCSLHTFRKEHPDMSWPHENWNSANVCGIFLSKAGIPSGLVTYHFQWYPCYDSFEVVMRLMDIRSERSFFQSPQTLLSEKEELVLLLLTALVLQHVRVANVWYAILQVPIELRSFYETHFRMTATDDANEDASADGTIRMVCDINKCSSRYAFLKYKADKKGRDSISLGRPHEQHMCRRWLAKLPSLEETTAALGDGPSEAVGEPQSKKSPPRKASTHFACASASVRNVQVSVRAKVALDEVELVKLDGSTGTEVGAIDVSKRVEQPLDMLRDFELKSTNGSGSNLAICELLGVLDQKQDELRRLESSMEPKIHSLMSSIVDERLEFELSNEAKMRSDESSLLEEYKRKLERRKEQDLAWQRQLEQDMNAVCDICNDGEVTPSNQILFCEACNVAVHQMCYGIDRVPSGDYYCIPCRYLGRDGSGRSRETQALRIAASPLPICCELCPRKQGAFIRTDYQGDDDVSKSIGKWVHAVCAKWQGLNFVRAPDLLEDVTDLKASFRRLNIGCSLCLGERGGMNKCRQSDCKEWLHITCARSVGYCEVVHGENVDGPVETNPWTLLCPSHSKVKAENIPKRSLPVDNLIRLAKGFPPEPRPPPTPMAPKPFNIASGEERAQLLLNKSYEQELLLELSCKKLFGVRCEVCDQDMDPKFRFRCCSCSVVVCADCTLEAERTEGNYRCAACVFVLSKQKAGEAFDEPRCVACSQKGGWLRPAYAKPISKKSQWNSVKKEVYQKTLFGHELWVHGLCQFWNRKLSMSSTGEVDCSQVVMTAGKTLIQASLFCFLCGQTGGLKVKCSREGCGYDVDGKRVDCAFHVTCARQAGLEVNAYEGHDGIMKFYVRCYRHGGNEYNLRARLEDLIEIEKRRSGKTLSRSDLPMGFAHASRLLHSAIVALRMLGWAWRWAELWVDYNSTWEPLLEPGEHEEDFTEEELKIVPSTRESRCADARKSRLAVFGAALRNRVYDQEDDYDRQSFESALRNILRTKSLVGPLEALEEDFFVHWLSLAYWSKSRLLGFGVDKIEVSNVNPLCLHKKDKSPKFALLERPIPGSGDTDVSEPDDFLLTEVITEEALSPSGKAPERQSSRIRLPSSPPQAVEEFRAAAPAVVKKRPGRPPKTAKRKIDKVHVSIQSLSISPPVVKKRRGSPDRSSYATESSGYVTKQLVRPTFPKKRVVAHKYATGRKPRHCRGCGKGVYECNGAKGGYVGGAQNCEFKCKGCGLGPLLCNCKGKAVRVTDRPQPSAIESESLLRPAIHVPRAPKETQVAAAPTTIRPLGTSEPLIDASGVATTGYDVVKQRQRRKATHWHIGPEQLSSKSRYGGTSQVEDTLKEQPEPSDLAPDSGDVASETKNLLSVSKVDDKGSTMASEEATAKASASAPEDFEPKHGMSSDVREVETVPQMLPESSISESIPNEVATQAASPMTPSSLEPRVRRSPESESPPSSSGMLPLKKRRGRTPRSISESVSLSMASRESDVSTGPIAPENAELEPAVAPSTMTANVEAPPAPDPESSRRKSTRQRTR